MAVCLASGSLLVVLTMAILLASDVPFSLNQTQGLNSRQMLRSSDASRSSIHCVRSLLLFPDACLPPPR
jgi:hypothetical protein